MSPVNWKKRMLSKEFDSTYTQGSTYLAVYAQIFNKTEHTKYDLTATVSIRNLNVADSIFINTIDYYNTEGKKVRSYIDQLVFLAPMETIEIVIDESDYEGGTGGNFVFNWHSKKELNEPSFESIMVYSFGQQGFAFTSKGQKLVQ